MTFTLSIRIVNDALAGVEFSDNTAPVVIGAALQALDAAKAALLNVPIAQAAPAPVATDNSVNRETGL